MNNETKQKLAALEVKISKLQKTLSNVAECLYVSQQEIYYCNKCGVNEPHENAYTCNYTNCPHGLNSNDEDKS